MLDPDKDITKEQVLDTLAVKTDVKTLINYDDIKNIDNKEIQQLKNDLRYRDTLKNYTVEDLEKYCEILNIPIDSVNKNGTTHWKKMRYVQILRLALLKTRSKEMTPDYKLKFVARILDVKYDKDNLDRKTLIKDIKKRLV